MKNIAIIPARCGSKGLKNKNIKELGGKPLLAYAIEAARESGVCDCIHVSTDSVEYANIAQSYGAHVPFLRDEFCASDSAGSWDVVKNVIEKYERIGTNFDRITLLQPTSPLRDSEDIKNAMDFYKEKNAKAVVSVCEMDHSPLWSNVLPQDCSMEKFNRDMEDVPRQALQTYYRINGAIYIVDKNFLLENANIYRKGCYAYIMDREKSIDIDTLFDFEMAEFLMHLKKKK